MKKTMSILSPRGWLLFALLSAETTRITSQNLVVTSTSSLKGAVEEPDFARGDDKEMPFNGNGTLSWKCGRYGYAYDEPSFGYEYGGSANAQYARLNDLKTSCKSPATNPRGSYTSKDLCYFAFHTIPGDVVPKNRLSEACSDANLVEESRAIKDDPVGHPVRSWPDTCVGDFPRCYSLDRDEAVLLRFLCTKKLQVPEGATHLSVDCTADKANLKKMLDNGELEDNQFDPYLRHQQKERLEYFKFAMAMALAACFCCFGVLFLVHRYAFKPYLKALKRNRSDPELAGLTASSDSSRA